MAEKKDDDRIRMGAVFDTRDSDHRNVLKDMETGMGTGKKMAIAPYMVNMYKNKQNMESEIASLKDENSRLLLTIEKTESERETLFRQNMQLQSYLMKFIELLGENPSKPVEPGMPGSEDVSANDKK